MASDVVDLRDFYRSVLGQVARRMIRRAIRRVWPELRGMRLLGGGAYFTATPMPRRMREAMLGLYAGGTVEIQRNVIAKSLGL